MLAPVAQGQGPRAEGQGPASPLGPRPSALGPSTPAAELSTITVPIRASLTSLQPELEKNVPLRFADSDTQKGIDIRYDIKRDPIRLAMSGPGLRATTTVHYRVEACRGRFPCISCGYEEAPRQAQITLHSKLAWDASWRITSKTTPLPTHYPKRCAVTWFDFDITDRFIAPAVQQQLAIAARTIDRNTPAVANIRPQAQQIWSELQKPIELAPRTWLVLDPIDVALTPLTGSGTDVTSTLSLRAQTRVIVGDKPAAGAKALPPLKVAGGVPSGIRVPLDLELPYSEATRLATAELGGKTYKVSGRDLKIDSIAIAPGTNNKLRISASIDYRGGALRNYRGIVHLDATPVFDPATQSIHFPDLEYALADRGSVFRRMAERAAHDTLRARLRENIRFPLGPQLTRLRNEVTRALTRPLGNGVMLRGQATAIQPVSVTPREKLVIHAIATGTAAVELRPGSIR